MNRKNLFGVLCLQAAILMGGSIVSAAEKVNREQSKPLPRVLLIGDSICGGYQRGVKKLLAGKAVVVKQQGNGEHTWTGLKKLDEWLGDGKWDVIHFNWGLWDVAYRNPKSKNFGHLDKVDGLGMTATPDKNASETKKSVKKLQEDFRKLNFGMFIHYNMATYEGVQWVAGYHSPSDFNPGVDRIDTDAWADAAVSAGMKYGVLTVKHVAGFCLWDSKHTTYDVMHPDCPYQKCNASVRIGHFLNLN